MRPEANALAGILVRKLDLDLQLLPILSEGHDAAQIPSAAPVFRKDRIASEVLVVVGMHKLPNLNSGKTIRLRDLAVDFRNVRSCCILHTNWLNTDLRQYRTWYKFGIEGYLREQIQLQGGARHTKWISYRVLRWQIKYTWCENS